MSRLGKTEKLIFFFASMALMVFSYFLYDDSLLFPKAQTQKQDLIGGVTTSQNDVRRKNLDTFSWLPASRSDAIYQNDSIFTGDRSEATITLQDGSQIHVEPNSLITLNVKNGQMTLDLRYGNLVSEVGANTALIVKSGAEEFKLENTSKSSEKSKIRFNKAHSGNVDLKLLAGQVHFSDKKNATKKELQKDTAMAVSAKGDIKQFEVAQIHISDQNKIDRIRTTPEEPLPFLWEGSGDISNYNFELSPSADFSKITFTKSTDLAKIDFTESLEPGEYFWRVQAKDHKGQIAVTSAPQKMTLKYLASPIILAPQKQAEFNLELKANPKEPLATTTEIKWQGADQFKTYTYQISEDPEFKKIFNEGETSERSVLSPRMPSGNYWLRVAGKTSDSAPLSWSEIVPFKIHLVAKKSPSLGRPILISEKINFKAPSTKDRVPAATTGPSLEWKPVAQSKKYKVQISKDLDFKNPETVETESTQLVWTQFKPGASYYRVFAVGPNNQTSPASNTGTIQIGLSGPVLSPIKSIQDLGEKLSSHEADLSWSEVPEAHAYSVQLGLDSNFNKPQIFEFKTNKGKINIQEPGTYKVRVLALDQENKPLTDFSNIENFNFTFQALLKSPILAEPFDHASIFLQKTTETAIWVEWRPVPEADSYRIEVSDKPDFSKILVSSSVEGTRFLLKNKIPLGKIYWRVQAQSKTSKKISNWTAKREFTIYHKEGETF